MVLFCFLPVIIIFIAWYWFGKELSSPDMPPELSFYPNERKAWEVSAFFNPPFASIDKNFFSAILIDFYHRKIIDIQMRDKELWIKVNQTKEKLDSIETRVFNFLKSLYSSDPWQYLKDNSEILGVDVVGISKKINSSGSIISRIFNANPSKKYLDGQYIYLKKALQSWNLDSYTKLTFKQVEKEIKKEKKKYLETTGATFITTLLIILFLLSQLFFGLLSSFFSKIYLVIGLYVIFLVTVIIINYESAMFVRFKEDYYKEYLHWQAFKEYLSHSFTISQGDHRAVAIWDHYLVYATALGVSKKVLKELKQANLIDERHYAIYAGIYASSPSFIASAGASGGGFGGAGGGGVGGGGGGGR